MSLHFQPVKQEEGDYRFHKSQPSPLFSLPPPLSPFLFRETICLLPSPFFDVPPLSACQEVGLGPDSPAPPVVLLGSAAISS